MAYILINIVSFNPCHFNPEYCLLQWLQADICPARTTPSSDSLPFPRSFSVFYSSTEQSCGFPFDKCLDFHDEEFHRSTSLILKVSQNTSPPVASQHWLLSTLPLLQC